MKNALDETVVSFGGQGGNSWDDGAHAEIREIVIYS